MTGKERGREESRSLQKREETLPLEVECRVILSHRSVCVLITVILKCLQLSPHPPPLPPLSTVGAACHLEG